jgi:hypothetical protein
MVGLMILILIGTAIGLFSTNSVVRTNEPERSLENPLVLLPQTSRHDFTPIDPAWQKSISYMTPFPVDSFKTVEKPASAEKTNLYMEIRFFAGSTENSNNAVKIRTYFPNRKLYSEIDNLHDEQFMRRFFMDGTFAEYTHWQKGKWIAGVAVDHTTGKVNHFSEGSGSLTSSSSRADTKKTTWYKDGRVFLDICYDQSRPSQITLHMNEAFLSVSKSKEDLYLISEHEFWSKSSGENPRVQLMGTRANSDINPPSPIRLGAPSDEETATEQLELQKIAKAWQEKRRPGFIKSYTEFLSTTGQSWQSLNIEFIRDDAPWPNR